MFIPKFINNCVVSQTVVRIDRNLTVSMKAESTGLESRSLPVKGCPPQGDSIVLENQNQNQSKGTAVRRATGIHWGP